MDGTSTKISPGTVHFDKLWSIHFCLSDRPFYYVLEHPLWSKIVHAWVFGPSSFTFTPWINSTFQKFVVKIKLSSQHKHFILTNTSENLFNTWLTSGSSGLYFRGLADVNLKLPSQIKSSDCFGYYFNCRLPRLLNTGLSIFWLRRVGNHFTSKMSQTDLLRQVKVQTSRNWYRLSYPDNAIFVWMNRRI